MVVFELVDVFETEHKVLRRLHFPSALFLFLFLRFRDSLGSVTVECSVVWLFLPQSDTCCGDCGCCVLLPVILAAQEVDNAFIAIVETHSASLDQ